MSQGPPALPGALGSPVFRVLSAHARAAPSVHAAGPQSEDANQSQPPTLSSLPEDSGASLATAAGILFWKLSSWLRLQQLPLSQQDVPSPLHPPTPTSCVSQAHHANQD